MIWTVFRWLLSLLLVLVGVAMVAGGLVLPELSADRFAYVGGGIACALVALAVLRRARDEDGTLGGLRRMSEDLRARRARIEREGLRGEAVVLDVARDGEDDDGPIVTLTLDVSVPGRAAERRTHFGSVSDTDLAALIPGVRLTVRIDPDDPTYQLVHLGRRLRAPTIRH